MKNIISISILIVLSLRLSGQPNAIFQGGDGHGYSSGKFVNTNSMFAGGEDDGYSLERYVNTNSIYAGGEDDGYSSFLFRIPFIWTGTIGTSWTVSGNWNYNLIPGIYRPVIIPDGVPNWPFVNSGLFAIGDNPNGSQYRCVSLWIQENALLVTRVNNRIENYGIITIDGIMQVKKQNADAFQNFDTGVVIVKSGGELKIKQ